MHTPTVPPARGEEVEDYETMYVVLPLILFLTPPPLLLLSSPPRTDDYLDWPVAVAEIEVLARQLSVVVDAAAEAAGSHPPSPLPPSCAAVSPAHECTMP